MKRELLKNKIFGILFIILGIISIWACDHDATFFRVCADVGNRTYSR